MRRSREAAWGAAGEAALLLLAGLVSWAAHTAFLFASLGPTVYEQVETPQRKTATPYSILVGHFVAIGAGLLGILATGAHAAPPLTPSGRFTMVRVVAVVIATGVTAGVTILLGASQPAALSTALLVSLGQMQSPKGVLAIVIGVLLVTAFGQPLRRYRLRHQMPPEQS